MQFDQDEAWLDDDPPVDEDTDDDVIDDPIDDERLAAEVSGDRNSVLDIDSDLVEMHLSSADCRHLAALRAIEIAREQRALRHALEDFPYD